jgi:hypothetical protein
MQTRIMLPFFLLATITSSITADTIKVTFNTPKSWRGETITLPPGFAKNMAVKGIEEIRFMPGMFKSDQQDFFSYALVFCLPKQKPLEKAAIHSELLKYYRGLATTVARGKKLKIDPDKFTLAITATKDKPGQYIGTLKWIEPFATGKAQTLRMEIKAGTCPNINASYLSMAVSPQTPKHELWKALRKALASVTYKNSDAAKN